MGINIADNFAYNGKKPLDNRTEYATLSAMKAVADASINEGCLAYNKEDGKYYKFLSTNTVDTTTGKWREFSTGGGGQTYNDFTGATASTAGAHGLVPAPSAGDEGKVLFGNGLWGALPSVDLSVLSNEAFIFSATEKPVGMARNRKILYAKTLNLNASDVNLDDNNNIGLSGVNIELAYGTVYMADGVITPLPYLNPAGLNNCAGFFFTSSLYLGLRFGTSQRSVSTITLYLFYTKTTDSPLPSDVKFAGVTSSGEVILKKEVTLGNLPNNSTKQVAHGITNIGRIWLGEAYGITTSKISVPLPFMNVQGNQYNIQIYVDSTNINIITASDNSAYSGYATVYYTLAS